AAAEDDRRFEIGCGVSDVVVEPKRAVRMVRQVRNDVAAANIDQAILHELGLDVEVVVDVFELGDQSTADQTVEVGAGDESHRITSSTGVKGRLKAPATPS